MVKAAAIVPGPVGFPNASARPKKAKNERKTKQICSILTFFTAAAEPVKKKHVFIKKRQGFSSKMQLD